MGQYWKVVNLDKKEYVSPYRLGTGAKLWEHLANHPSSGTALIVLCAAMPQARGGGDLDLDTNWHGPERNGTRPGPMPEEYPAIAARTIGRWAGDRIAFIGDYAEPDDLKHTGLDASMIYSCCCKTDEDFKSMLAGISGGDAAKFKAKAKALGRFTDISADVAAVIEHELQGRFVPMSPGSDLCDWRPVEEPVIVQGNAAQKTADIPIVS